MEKGGVIIAFCALKKTGPAMLRKVICITLSGVLLCLAGCASHNVTMSYMRENTSLGHIRHVAVLPFEGGGRAARIRELTITQLLSAHTFDVVDEGLVDSALKQEAIRPGEPLDKGTLKRLGQLLNVQAFILGSVEETAQSRGASGFAETIITMRLIDSQTGTLLWQASGRGTSYSLADRLFGLTPKDSFLVTMDLLRDLFKTMR